MIIDKEGKINLNFEDDLVKGTCIAYDGKITNAKIDELANGQIAMKAQ